MKCICNNCMNYPCTDGMSVMLKSCPAYSPKPKPLTNADKIRAMTDEELAELLTKFAASLIKQVPDSELSDTFKEDTLKWLREEASDETD